MFLQEGTAIAVDELKEEQIENTINVEFKDITVSSNVLCVYVLVVDLGQLPPPPWRYVALRVLQRIGSAVGNTCPICAPHSLSLLYVL